MWAELEEIKVRRAPPPLSTCAAGVMVHTDTYLMFITSYRSNFRRNNYPLSGDSDSMLRRGKRWLLMLGWEWSGGRGGVGIESGQ